MTTGFALLAAGAVGLTVAGYLAERAPRAPDPRAGPEPATPLAWLFLARASLAAAAGALLAVPAYPVLAGNGKPPPPCLGLSALALLPFAVAAGGRALAPALGRPCRQPGGGSPPAPASEWLEPALYTGVIGLAATAAVFELLVRPPWPSSVLLTSLAATGALAGGLTLMLLTPPDPDTVSPSSRPDGRRAPAPVPAPGSVAKAAVLPPVDPGPAMAAAGVLLSTLALAQVGWGWLCLGAFRMPPGPLLLWLAGSIPLPGVALLLACRTPSRPALARMLAGLALAAALAGQGAALSVSLGFSPIVPPPGG
ncbi:hypothetical protein [Caldinitratiruptor microaerophilus]|uniref:Uncharacterized protein n=1 Tax=Caldinitratiruptor microaerophilus TaxID=671077 RepID=A0AA35CLR1_9FIRM|nr:hypothetical protein [Caldinitratiruptor microaerophilus]BDG61649.1 hypothetical protein caldi_27390 [Caldinitratiruptor microaerophilus]